MAPRTRFECRIAGRRLSHVPPSGSLAICPAGTDCAADADESVAALVVAIDPGRLALTAAARPTSHLEPLKAFTPHRSPSLLEGVLAVIGAS